MAESLVKLCPTVIWNTEFEVMNLDFSGEILKVLNMWLGFFLLLKIKWKGKEIRKGEQLNQKGTWT